MLQGRFLNSSNKVFTGRVSPFTGRGSNHQLPVWHIVESVRVACFGGNVFIMIMSHHDAWARRPAMHWQSEPTPPGRPLARSRVRPGPARASHWHGPLPSLPGWQAVQPPGQAGRARGLTEPARLRRSLSLRLAVTSLSGCHGVARGPGPGSSRTQAPTVTVTRTRGRLRLQS